MIRFNSNDCFVLQCFVSPNQFWFTKLSHVALWLTRPTTKTQMILFFSSLLHLKLRFIFFPLHLQLRGFVFLFWWISNYNEDTFSFFSWTCFCVRRSCGSYYLVECKVSLSAFNSTSSFCTMQWYLVVNHFFHS